MSVLERYKQRSAYRKSEGRSLSPTETNIYQPSPAGQSSLFASSAQVDEATPVPQFSFPNNPVSSVSADGLETPVMLEETPTAEVVCVLPDDQAVLFASSAQVDEVTPVPQFSFPDNPVSSVSAAGLETSVMLEETPTAAVACVLPDDQAVIPVQADSEIAVPPLRGPVRIPSTGKKSSGMMFAPKVTGKRTRTHAAMLILTAFVILGVLVTVVPLTRDGQALGGSSLLSSFMRWTHGKNGNTALISPQLATATAVMQDGYDAGGGVTYPGIPSAPAPTSGSPNLNRFFYGQCTYYANMEYGALTGRYVPWLGNADAWPYQASAYGWRVSSTPTVPSIIAFAPYVDGAGAYGHVGVVTSVNGNQVTYGSWNTYGAPFATTVYLTVTAPAGGVSFITYS